LALVLGGSQHIVFRMGLSHEEAHIPLEGGFLTTVRAAILDFKSLKEDLLLCLCPQSFSILQSTVAKVLLIAEQEHAAF